MLRWLPGYARRRATRQERAIDGWRTEYIATNDVQKPGAYKDALWQVCQVLMSAGNAASGYLRAGDWTGVEAQYLRARRAIDAHLESFDEKISK